MPGPEGKQQADGQQGHRRAQPRAGVFHGQRVGADDQTIRAQRHIHAEPVAELGRPLRHMAAQHGIGCRRQRVGHGNDEGHEQHGNEVGAQEAATQPDGQGDQHAQPRAQPHARRHADGSEEQIGEGDGDEAREPQGERQLVRFAAGLSALSSCAGHEAPNADDQHDGRERASLPDPAFAGERDQRGRGIDAQRRAQPQGVRPGLLPSVVTVCAHQPLTLLRSHACPHLVMRAPKLHEKPKPGAQPQEFQL